MNKNKIISTILISTMLAEAIPTVNASVVEIENLIEDEFIENESTENIDIEYSKDNQSIEDSNSNNIDFFDKENNLVEDMTSDGTPQMDIIEEKKDTSNDSTNINNEEIVNNKDFDTNENNSENKIPSEEISKDTIEDAIAIDSIENNSSDALGKSVIVNNGAIEVTLGEDEYVPVLTGNPDEYITIKIITTGNKKLVKEDYDNLRESKIPNVDLSNAKSDTIPQNAFKEAIHITSFKFPEGVKTISGYAFYNCTNLKGNLVIPNSVTSIQYNAFQNCSGFTGDLVIPSSVSSIGNSAFSGCTGFTGRLVIPNSVTKIGGYVFYKCTGFTGNLVIPSSVTSIGNGSFYNCKGFTGKLMIPNSVTSIGNEAFSGCSGFTGDLIIPDSVISLGDSVFESCDGLNGNLVLSDSVTSIGKKAFKGCSNLTGNLILPKNITSIKDSVFLDCSGFNGSLVIPDKVISIGAYAFKNCSGLTGNLTISDSVTSIGKFAFQNCHGFIGDLKIPNSVVTIDMAAFENCSGFNGSLTLPNSISVVSSSTFSGCTGFNGRLTIPASVTTIGNYAFSGCKGFTGDLIIPDMVTSIGDYAFQDCTGFKGNLVIPNSLTAIGNYTFNGCTGFTGNLVIPKSVVSIGNYAFFRCKGFTGDLAIPNSVTSIGYNAFSYCYGFTGNLVIGNSVTFIGNSAFLNCYNINKIIFNVDKSFENNDYRKNIFDSLDKDKVVVEMSYDFDTSGTWLDGLNKNQNGKPKVKFELDAAGEDKNIPVSLYVPTPYKEDNISILKDGKDFNLPKKNTDGKYIFNEEGIYNITITTNLGTISTIDFEVVVLINKPIIQYENNFVSIIDNGNNLGTVTDRIEYRLNGGDWIIYQGPFRIPDKLVNGTDNIKVEARVITEDKISKVTEQLLTIQKAQINAEDIEIVEGDNFDENSVNISAIDIDGTDISSRVIVVSSNVKTDTPGEYTVVYKVEAINGYFTEKEVKVTVLKKKLPPVINVNNITLNQGSKFNPLDFVTITDDKGTLLDKSKVEIVENTVNTAKPGKYIVTYKFEDDNGLVTTKTVDVVVKEVSSDDNSNANNSGNNDTNSGSNNSNTSDNNTNNDNSNSNENKIPNAGGNASLLYLSSIMSIIGGCYFTGKKKNKH